MSATLHGPTQRTRPAARWTGALFLAAAAHVTAGAAWLMHASLAPSDPPAAVLVDMEPLLETEQPKPEPEKPELEKAEPPPQPEPLQPEPLQPEPRGPEPAPQEPPPQQVPPEPQPPEPQPEPPPVEMPPGTPPPETPPPEVPPPDVLPPPPKPVPPRPASRPVPRPMPGVSQPAAAQPAAPPQATAPAPALPRSATVSTSWLSRLFAHLARHKRYPPEAQQRRQEGTPQLRLVMDRTGRVLSLVLERSSGFPLLDGEAQAMVRRAEPLPALPDDMPGPTIEMVVPLNFHLR